MPGNSRGKMFKVSSWGESHGESTGVLIDGCPPGLGLLAGDIQRELDRRKPGQSDLSSSRKESDLVRIRSGVFEGETLGTPIALEVMNRDVRSADYSRFKGLYRPSHADYTYKAKYGRRDWRGGGRASARETVSRVAAGAVARKWLFEKHGVEIFAWVDSVGDLAVEKLDMNSLDRSRIEANRVRCPVSRLAVEMEKLILRVKSAGDSIGGTVGFLARSVPPGWGEPVFDKLDGELGRALLSLPAAKGVEIGSGFSGSQQRGSAHNDPFKMENGRVVTKSNNSGGIQGGISNGMPLTGRVAFKPVPTINQPQTTIDSDLKEVEVEGKGRHDPCVLPRAVPVVEAELALVLIDLALQQRGQTGD